MQAKETEHLKQMKILAEVRAGYRAFDGFVVSFSVILCNIVAVNKKKI